MGGENPEHALNQRKLSLKRVQLTLFLDEQISASIENIRRTFNPEQYGLIKSHVTLCREDELEQTENVLLNLTGLNPGSIVVHFGKPVRFSAGKGVLLPAVGGNESFHALRAALLKGVIEEPRRHEPHITLMHPRNSTCTDSIFREIEQTQLPGKIVFRKISLIEQVAGGPWKVLRTFGLQGLDDAGN